MGCGTADSQIIDRADDIDNEDEILNELYGEKVFYDKQTDVYISEKAYKPDPGERTGGAKTLASTFVEPAKHPAFNPDEPEDNYELEYVYGYRGYDCRQNLYFTESGRVAYCVASLGVVLDPHTNTQRFFAAGHSTKQPASQYHDGDVVCLAVSSDRKLAATGQAGKKPVLNVWDVETGALRCSHAVTQKLAKAIVCCAWSASGRHIAFADKHDKYNIYVIDAATGKLVFTKPNDGQQIIDIAWSKNQHNNLFAVCGIKNIGFWTIGGYCTRGAGQGKKSFAALTFDENDTCYAGGFNGNIYAFKKAALSNTVTAHKGAIISICWSSDRLYTGGTDNYILIFDNTFRYLNRIYTKSCPRSLDIRDDNLLVGLRDGSISLVPTSEAVLTNYLMKSHHDGEVWGLNITEDGNVITAGDDNKVMVWAPSERRNKVVGAIKVLENGSEKVEERAAHKASAVTMLSSDQCARAVAVNAKTAEVALGLNNGQVQIRDIGGIDVVKKSVKAGERWIEAMAYSPNGEHLAVGTHDSAVVLYSTDTYHQTRTAKVDSTPVISLDWSNDSKYIRVVSQSNKYLFFTVDNMEQDPNGAANTKGLDWATQSCKLGWSVQGIFEGNNDFGEINGVAISSKEKLIACGNDNGVISIFRNPCLKGSKAKKLYGHTHSVVRVKFGLNDQHIFSVGGQDKTLMQWRKC
eukprot:TRINITY_DN294_c0_g1_i12.p1 TRINITY_DN294_c0_g1~~TRINITY_DN294_c0_g1_i12.p1  ORF type:complete len:691 (+),score=144.01 TRINITY_DN294_c0_g1_i12:351-2423(+)